MLIASPPPSPSSRHRGQHALQASVELLPSRVAWTPLAGILPDQWCRYGAADVLRVLRKKRVVISGGSTTRHLFEHLLRQLGAMGDGVAPRCLPCDPQLGLGCSNCFASGCAGRFKGWLPGWNDFVYDSRAWDLSLHFTWKPEMFTDDDHVFLTRLCQAPPDVLLLSKGPHDVIFRRSRRLNRSGTLDLRAHEALVLRDWQRLLAATTCLPQSTVVIWRTPYVYGSEHDTASPDLVEERRLMTNVTRRVTHAACRNMQATRPRLFCVDAFAFTDASTNGNARTPRPFDKVHFRDRVWNVMLDVLLNLIERASRLPLGSNSDSRHLWQTLDDACPATDAGGGPRCRVLSPYYRQDFNVSAEAAASTRTTYCDHVGDDFEIGDSRRAECGELVASRATGRGVAVSRLSQFHTA